MTGHVSSSKTWTCVPNFDKLIGGCVNRSHKIDHWGLLVLHACWAILFWYDLTVCAFLYTHTYIKKTTWLWLGARTYMICIYIFCITIHYITTSTYRFKPLTLIIHVMGHLLIALHFQKCHSVMKNKWVKLNHWRNCQAASLVYYYSKPPDQ